MAKRARAERIPEDFGDCTPHQQRAWFERRERRLAEPNPFLRNEDGVKILTQAEKERIWAEAQAIDKRVNNDWDRETTIARRAEWNARVKSGQFGRIGSGKPNWAALRKQERE